MKNKNKLFIIVGSIILVLALAVGAYFIFFNGDDETKKESSNNEDKLVAPASNTEDLIEEMEIVEVTNVTEDEIVFSDNVDLKENDKVAVWIYSEPKFLGYFEVLVEKGVKKIVGLKKALESISIEVGEHNIAITTESGDPIGYIDVKIKDNGKLTENKEAVEDSEKEENNEEDNKTTTNKNNSTSSLSTIDLVGNWKCASSENYYTFKKDGTGILYLNDTGITVEHTFKWKLSGKKLSINYSEGWLGSTSQEIIIYNENKIDIQPRTQVIYNRYYGKIPKNKEYDKTLDFKVKYVNIPNGLEVADGNSTTEKVRIKTKDANLLNNTYEIIFDLSNCTVNSCNAKPSFDLPKGIEVVSSVISKSVNLRNKRYYRDVYFDICYVNFSDGYYNATASKNVFKANVYAESEADLDNSTYVVYVDMKENNSPGTWNVVAEYSASGKANLTIEGLSENITVTVTEK